MTGPSGRSCERGSPSKLTKPLARAASGGKKRITVPAFPTSIEVGPKSGPGVISQLSSPFVSIVSSMPIPSDRKPCAINSVSRDRSGLRSLEGLDARALKIKARLVTDLEPGIVMVACTGFEPRNGARHI